MEILRDTHISFMKYRKFWMTLSITLIVVSLGFVMLQGKLNLGIDFAGGTQLTLKFRDEPPIELIRQAVESAGIDDAQIQGFGDAGDNELIVRTPLVEEQEEGSRAELESAIASVLGEASDGFDLNRQGTEALSSFLFERDPDQLTAQDPITARAHYGEVAAAISEVRKTAGLLTSWEPLSGVSEASEATRSVLSSDARLGGFRVLGSEYVSPQIGGELRSKGLWAIALSLLGMMTYIWFRFELRYGIGALAAVVHDIAVVLGLFALLGFEFNLTTVAAFLTLVGYSVNDSVVVFDRMRENIRKRRSTPLIDIMDNSINQTLSRTILTSTTTLAVVATLLFYGGDGLRGFAFVLTIGVVVGTYSSIYIASPFALWWEGRFGKQARTQRKEARA